MEKVDVAVIGAGLAGLTCAQQLRQAGYPVTVLEKSRGLGGRAATRRFEETWADHGLRYLGQQGEQQDDPLSGERRSNRTQTFIDRLLSEGIITSWTDTAHTLNAADEITVDSAHHWRYAAPMGMSAIAKPLAIDLDVRRNHRVMAVSPTTEGWKLAIESSPESIPPLFARSLVIAIPAPQALALVEPLVDSPEIASQELTDMASKLRSVQYDPCLTAIAVYPVEQSADSQTIPWKALTFAGDPVLNWIGFDSSKRLNAAQPVFVLHSTAAFAEQFFDAPDLQAVGQQMLDRAAQRLIPWLNNAELLQVHRWRYAFVKQGLRESCLVSSLPLPIVCCGDWCREQQVESALASGSAAGDRVGDLLGNG